MAGRIRTLKPEWLEDQRLLACSERARLLTVVLILIADDYGNGRGHPDFVKAQAGLYDVTTPDLESALFELQNCGFIELYLHNQQSYFSIRNWDKHQRVDKPGKPRVPPPSERDRPEAERPRKSSYFIRGTLTGLIKIGESIDPVARLGDLAACGSEPLELLAVCSVPERALHAELAEHRVHGEWFTPSDAVIAKIREHSRGAISVLATAGYANGRKILESSEKVPARFRTDHDHDHEEDRDQDREIAAPPAPPAPAKSKPVADPGYAATIAAFDAAYAAQTGSKPTWGAKQGAMVKRLIAAHGAAETQARIARLFAGAIAAWCHPPYDLGTLVQHFDKLADVTAPPVAAPRPSQQQLRGLAAVLSVDTSELQ